MKRSWRARGAAGIVIIVLWSFIAWNAATFLIVTVPLSRADAIVVLSGAATVRERAQWAASLYHQGRSQRIILTNDDQRSSWSSAEQRNPYYYQLAMEVLQRLGVPQQNVELIAVPVRSTYDEAVLLRQYCETNGVRTLLVVTSAYHSRRATWIFRQQFQGSATQIGMDPVESWVQSPKPSSWWLHLLGWQMVPTEYVKMMYYWMRLQ